MTKRRGIRTQNPAESRSALRRIDQDIVRVVASLTPKCEKLDQLLAQVGTETDKLTKTKEALRLLAAGVSGAQIAAAIEESPTSLSRNLVKPLKEQDNPPLFEQHSRDVRATRWLDRFLLHLHGVIAELEATLDESACSIHIGGWSSLLTNYLPEVFRQLGVDRANFHERFPNMHFECEELAESQVLDRFLADRLDFALCGKLDLGRRNDQFIQTELFTSQPLGLLIPAPSRDHDRERGGRADFERWWMQRNKEPFQWELLRHFTFFECGPWFRQELAGIDEDAESYLRRRIVVYTYRDALRCVEEGLGVALGHKPSAGSVALGVRFLPAEILVDPKWTKSQQTKFQTTLTASWPVYLIRCRKELTGKRGEQQRALYDLVLDAIFKTAHKFPYRAT